MERRDAVVVGGGVIGLSSAWLAASRGLDVALVDRAPASGASFVAAGMLAPVGEVSYGEEELLKVNLRSASAWPKFAGDLERASGLSVGYLACGTLAVAADESDRVALEELHRFQVELGLDSRSVTTAGCRSLEPLLSPRVSGGLEVPGDHQVDPRLVVVALIEAARRAGVTFIEAAATEICSSGGKVTGVACDNGTSYLASRVVLAAGHASGTIGGLPEPERPAVRPVKGQILRLVWPRTMTPLGRNLRLLVRGTSLYVVPRASGEVVVGATVEERGGDTTVTAGAVYELLRDAIAVLPVLLEAELAETSAGLRPGSFDNMPLVGSGYLEGLVVATGHYRNGILLAPVTAEVVVALLTGEAAPSWASCISPARAHAR